jgi:hypothetical protein
VYDSCTGTFGPSPFALSHGGLGLGGWEFLNCLFKSCGGLDPSGSYSTTLNFITGLSYSLSSVKIQGSPGDAIHAEGPSLTILENVTGGTGGIGDPTNAGFGVRVNDGAFVRVRDDATLVTGTAGDMKVGSLPLRSLSPVAGAGWADFRTAAPIKNEYDLTTPFTMNLLSGLSTPGGNVTGTGDSFAEAAGIVTLTDAAALFTADMVGDKITISGATSPGNDGTFTILSVGGGGTTVTYANATGMTEVFPGTWEVFTSRTGSRLFQRP